jgi:hypothetical protein
MEASTTMGQEIIVVTTFHPEGMEVYGQRFIDSFAKNVAKAIKLVVYAEDCNPINPDSNQITILDAKESLPKLNAFKERWKNDPKANGIPPADIKARRPRDWHKEFKWHAIRFANKTYAVFDACEKNYGTGRWVVWMDADTFVHSPWSLKQFEELLPYNNWITYVGRGKGSQTWPECGFYGINMNHPVGCSFVEEFERMYEDADNGIFKLEEWHDSYVFGELLNNKFLDFKDKAHDYSANIYNKTAKTGGGGHPLINSELGKWMDHMKGARKFDGKSKRKDLMTDRTETYWQTVK